MPRWEDHLPLHNPTLQRQGYSYSYLWQHLGVEGLTTAAAGVASMVYFGIQQAALGFIVGVVGATFSALTLGVFLGAAPTLLGWLSSSVYYVAKIGVSLLFLANCLALGLRWNSG